MDIAGQLCYNEQNYDRPRRERNVAAMKGTLIGIGGSILFSMRLGQNDKKDALRHLFYFAKTWNVSYDQGIYLKGIKIRKGVLQWPYQI